jgi:hypothetical protein
MPLLAGNSVANRREREADARPASDDELLRTTEEVTTDLEPDEGRRLAGRLRRVDCQVGDESCTSHIGIALCAHMPRVFESPPHSSRTTRDGRGQSGCQCRYLEVPREDARPDKKAQKRSCLLVISRGTCTHSRSVDMQLSSAANHSGVSEEQSSSLQVSYNAVRAKHTADERQ